VIECDYRRVVAVETRLFCEAVTYCIFAYLAVVAQQRAYMLKYRSVLSNSWHGGLIMLLTSFFFFFLQSVKAYSHPPKYINTFLQPLLKKGAITY
jgi:hypothetical protein